MIKKFFYILFSFLIINQVSAFDIREVNNAKVMSKASYDLNDTNTSKKENIELINNLGRNILNETTRELNKIINK